ncbi:MAG: PIN domain-containing protein [Chloroflexota bacterium]
MTILADTSGLYALMDRSERAHASVAALVSRTRALIVIPVLTLVEVDYLLHQRLGGHMAAAFASAVASGEFSLEGLVPGDLARAVEVMRQYSDARIGLVDASVVATAERLGVPRILTLDRRHFSMFRPRHCAAFELLP